MALVIPAKVAKQIRKSGIPRRDWERLRESLEAFARDPYAHHPKVKPLVGGGYRVEHGVWRAVCDINDKGNVEVIRVRHRREAYRP
jgi:mRNA-degrading endonuclease RelE of RelBE toxin-antitoxin system